MENMRIKALIISIIFLAFSCGEPDTTVTNIIHPDGSVTRRIEMRSQSKSVVVRKNQVPYDSTWVIKDTIEISKEKDTVYIRTAEKYFRTSEEINKLYINGISANSECRRSVAFEKRFRWFYTTIGFKERFESSIMYGYPLSEFFTENELEYFYLPDNIRKEKENGPDSTRYKALSDSIDTRTEYWMTRSLVSEWIEEFTRMLGDRAVKDLSKEALKKKEELVSRLIPEGSDSSLFITMLGKDNYKVFDAEADSATKVIEERFDNQFSFVPYNVRFIMPGKVVATNALIDDSGELNWSVKAEYFFTTPYEMWAESKISNIWAWIVSGIFLLFVVLGLLIRNRRKK